MNVASSPVLAAPLSRASLAVRVVSVVLGSLFIAASAQIFVPMYPVMVSMQTFAVLVVGMLFGPRLAVLTVGLYIAEGVAGLPVFQGWTNAAMLIAKPSTIGYLAGFFAMAAVAGAIVARGRGSLFSHVAAVIAGEVVLYAIAVPVLAGLVGWDKAITFGLVPFLVGDPIKAALAVAVAMAGGRLIGRAIR